MVGEGEPVYVCQRSANGWNQGPDKVLYLYREGSGKWCAVHADKHLTKADFMKAVDAEHVSAAFGSSGDVLQPGWWMWDYFDNEIGAWTQLGEFETCIFQVNAWRF